MARLPAEVVTRLLDGHTLARATAGGVLYRPGELAGLHVVVEGLIRVSLTSEEGRQVTVRYARRGDVLGVPVAVSGSAPVHAQAVTDAVTASTRPDLVTVLARRDPRVANWMVEELGARVEGLLQELAMNTFWPVRRRLARHLLDLAADAQEGGVLRVRASHQELADHIGSVREVVARTLGALRSSGYLVADTDGLRLTDPGALANLT